jgi:hypothetical protein
MFNLPQAEVLAGFKPGLKGRLLTCNRQKIATATDKHASIKGY